MHTQSIIPVTRPDRHPPQHRHAHAYATLHRPLTGPGPTTWLAQQHNQPIILQCTHAALASRTVRMHARMLGNSALTRARRPHTNATRQPHPLALTRRAASLTRMPGSAAGGKPGHRHSQQAQPVVNGAAVGACIPTPGHLPAAPALARPRWPAAHWLSEDHPV